MNILPGCVFPYQEHYYTYYVIIPYFADGTVELKKKGLANMLGSRREFYAAKSCTKLHIRIYICPTQKKYNIYLHNKQFERRTKRYSFTHNMKILLLFCFFFFFVLRRFFFVSGEVLFRKPDLSKPDLSLKIHFFKNSTNQYCTFHENFDLDLFLPYEFKKREEQIGLAIVLFTASLVF